MTEKRITQKQLQSQRTAASIRSAVDEVLREKAFDQFTIKDICQKANIAVGTFYKYYKNKEDIFTDRYRLIDRYFADTVAPAMIEQSVMDNLLRFAAFYFDYGEKKGLQVSRQILKARLSDTTQAALKRDRPFYAILDGLFSAAQRSGEIRLDVTPQMLSDMYMILLRGYSFNRAVHGQIVPSDQAIEKHIRIWCDAFLAQGEEAAR